MCVSARVRTCVSVRQRAAGGGGRVSPIDKRARLRDRHRTETERNTVDADIKIKWQTPNCVSHPASNPSCLNQDTHTSRTRKQRSLTISTDTHVGKYGAQTHRFLSKSAHRLGLFKPNAEANSSPSMQRKTVDQHHYSYRTDQPSRKPIAV